jgi:hypothetical protein
MKGLYLSLALLLRCCDGVNSEYRIDPCGTNRTVRPGADIPPQPGDTVFPPGNGPAPPPDVTPPPVCVPYSTVCSPCFPVCGDGLQVCHDGCSNWNVACHTACDSV